MKYKLSNTGSAQLAVGKWLIAPSSYVIADEWEMNYVEHWNQVNEDVVGTDLVITPIATELDQELGGGDAALMVRAGEAIAAGELVYISSWNETDECPVVMKADADAIAKLAVYVAPALIAINTTGTVVKKYRLGSQNTNAGTVGDAVYLSQTAGGWTLSAPAANVQVVGRVAVKSATVGAVEFDVTDVFLLSTTEAIVGLTASAAELNFNDTAVAGTAVASKTLVLGATKNVDTLLIDSGTKAAAGNSQGTATALTADTTYVTAADDTKGVVLPTAVAGNRFIVINTVTNKHLYVYPASGAQINALGANNPFQLEAAGILVLYAISATLWYAFPAYMNLTADAAELNYNDTAVAGTAVASKTLVLGATKNVDTLLVDSGTKAAAGSDQGTATALTADTTYVTAADDTKGVVLPTAVAGKRLIVINTVTNKHLHVYPASGAQINALGANNPFQLEAAGILVLYAISATLWYAFPAYMNLTADATQLNSCDASIGAVAGTGVTVSELGFGYHKTTVFTLVDVAVPLVDEAGEVAYGGLKIYDFPQGYLYTQSAVADLAITKSSAGVNDDWDGDIGLGTVTASNNATLTATEQNVIPSTPTPQAVAGATTGDAVSTASEHAILDGTSAAIELFVNLLVDDTDHDVTSTPCNLILNGTIVLNWIFMGDN